MQTARGIKDTSRGGRYHNKRFRMTAELVGLDVSAMPPYGWARTELTAEAVERYREAIDSLGDAMHIARRVERFRFDRIYGGWASTIRSGARAALETSAARYIQFLRGEAPG